MLHLGRASALGAVAVALLLLVAETLPGAAQDAPGNARRGAKLMVQYGCGACHAIPGIANADGLVGPPLDNIGSRTVIAGLLPNTPENMNRWLENPQAIVPGNVMPDVGMSAGDAADITAYLEALRQ